MMDDEYRMVKKMKNHFILRSSSFIVFAVLMLASSFVNAQGSSYNFIGFGLPVRSADPGIEALGGAGAALLGSRSINDINPADWTWLARARFGIALDFNYSSAQIGGVQEQQHNF